MIAGNEWIILILAAVILLFGAKKIPEFARSLGKAKAEFQRGQKMAEREIREEFARYDDEKKLESTKVKNAAEALGIKTEGKTDAELKSEIAAKMA